MAQPGMDDLLIRGATLYDGSGGDPFRADLAVRAGGIRALGASLPVSAQRVIGADGLESTGAGGRGVYMVTKGAQMPVALTVGRGMSRLVFDLTGGAPRLHTDALGVHGVWVNGERVGDGEGLRTDGRLAVQVITRFVH